MHTFVIVFVTALVSSLATATLLFRSKIKGRAFRPVYTKRKSVLYDGERRDYLILEPYLEKSGMKLLPSVPLQQIAATRSDLPSGESRTAFGELDGRTVQFLLVDSNLAPMAVVNIGGDGTRPQLPEHMFSGVKFCSALFESIGVPEIVVYDADMKDPEKVAGRIREIVSMGKTGVIRV